MKHFLTIFLLFFCLSRLSAQERHFVFIQSDTKQPFYVSVNGKLYSSSASGYVIIPKLADGNYNFTVGFAQNAFPEQTFSFAVQNKDLGFDLKNFNEKGWGLFNLQSLDITMASAANSNVVAKALSENTKAPAEVISFDKKKEPVVVATKPAETDVAQPTKSEKVPAETPAESVAAVASKSPESAQNSAPASKSLATETKVEKGNDVNKVSEVTGDDGVRLSYVEGPGKTKDTINIIIPSSPAAPVNSSNPNASSVASQGREVSKAPSSTSSTANSNNSVKFLDISAGAKKDTVQAEASTKETGRIFENSNCKNIANEDDYMRLRKKMSMETTDEKMINEARKFYRNKCFTTSQIKGLSTLFLSDEGRLKFFDASFVSVADASQYTTLQTEFVDPGFVTRFKAMLQ